MGKILEFKIPKKAVKDEKELVKSVLGGVLTLEEVNQLKKELDEDPKPGKEGGAADPVVLLLIAALILATLSLAFI